MAKAKQTKRAKRTEQTKHKTIYVIYNRGKIDESRTQELIEGILSVYFDQHSRLLGIELSGVPGGNVLQQYEDDDGVSHLDVYAPAKVMKEIRERAMAKMTEERE